MKPLDPRLLRRSRPVRRLLVVSVLLGLATVVTIVAQAWPVADIVSLRFDGRPLLALPIAVVGCLGARSMIRWAHTVVSARAAATVKAGLRDEIIDDLMDPRRLGTRPESSRVIGLLGPGLDAFDGYVGRFLPQVVLAAIAPAFIIVVVALADPWSALVIAVTLPLVVIFMALVGMLTRDRVDRRWQALERLGRHFADVVDGLVVLKVFGRRQEEGLRQIGDRHRRETVRALRLAFLSSLVLELFATIAVALVAVGVGLRVVEGNLALQPALLVLLLAPEAFAPIRQVGAQFHDSTAGAEAAAEALAFLEHDRHTGTITAPDLAAVDIALDGVVLQHPDRAGPSLSVEHERVRPREVVAVTGPSGCGKSTLLSILMAFERPTEGRVLVNGLDLATIDPSSWRSQIAWVPQVPALIHGTVEQNVRLDDVHASWADVRRALSDAGAGVLELDHRVTESGSGLSAGERRRVAIARALLRARRGQVRLLLLDEPTAGLDHDRETQVLASVRELGLTVVVVAHRPATVAAADREMRLGAPALVTS